MEIIEVISNHIDKAQNIIIVEFRTTEDNEDLVREDFIEYSHYEDFGYDNKNAFEILSEDYGDEWEDDDFDYIDDDENLLSFLNEYYVVYPNKLPKAQFR